MSILHTLKKELQFIFVAALGSILMVIICSPLIGAVLLVEMYGPEWLKWTVAFAWVPALLFWDTIKAIFKSIKGVFK